MIINLNKYTPTSTDKILVDANVLIYVFSPFPASLSISEGHLKLYTSAFEKIVQNQNGFISAYSLGEFVNRTLKTDFERWSKQEKFKGQKLSYKKDYRPTDDYKELLASLVKETQKILKLLKPVGDGFSAFYEPKLDEYMSTMDFVDIVLGYVAKSQGYKILTHDADFAALKNDVDLITANYKLLN